jgi:uncharacterized protein YkwD
LSGLRGRVPDDTAYIDEYAQSPGWAPSVAFDPVPPERPARKMSPIAITGMVAAILISLGLAVSLLSPAFSGQPLSKAPNLPGVIEEPGSGAPAVPAPTDQAEPPVAPPSDAPTASAEPTPTPTGNAATGNAAAENAVVALVNRERRKAKCDPVTNDDRLRTAARQHSADMAAGGFLRHRGSDGSSADDRMRAAGYGAPLSENLARGFRSARDVTNGWLGSREQRDNILDCDARAVGVGVSVAADGTPYWTQVFGQ